MKHMKKAVLFAAICCMAFAGCGKSEQESAEEPVSTESVVMDEVETEETTKVDYLKQERVREKI